MLTESGISLFRFRSLNFLLVFELLSVLNQSWVKMSGPTITSLYCSWRSMTQIEHSRSHASSISHSHQPNCPQGLISSL